MHIKMNNFSEIIENNYFQNDTVAQTHLAKPTGRKFQPKWIENYPWIIYDSQLDKVYCSKCKTAVEKNIILPINACNDIKSKETFVVNGFSNWKKGLERFKSHEVKYKLFNYFFGPVVMSICVYVSMCDV